MGLWSWLRGWWRKRPLDAVEVTLYTRRGCHLCETAHEQLESARRRWGFRLTIVDVDMDMELVRLHGESVPVVAIDGKVRFRGRINEVLLTRLLRASGRRLE